jgi:hypothetical protein
MRRETYHSAWQRPPPKWRREWRRTVFLLATVAVLLGALIAAVVRS